jgi:hypothetical protein
LLAITMVPLPLAGSFATFVALMGLAGIAWAPMTAAMFAVLDRRCESRHRRRIGRLDDGDVHRRDGRGLLRRRCARRCRRRFAGAVGLAGPRRLRARAGDGARADLLAGSTAG